MLSTGASGLGVGVGTQNGAVSLFSILVFPQISQFLHTAQTASTRRIGSKCVHFRGVLWIRAIFGSKSTKFRRLGQRVTGT